MTRMTEMIPLICLSSAFLCATSVFCVSVVEFSRQPLTTEAQRTQRTHRDF